MRDLCISREVDLVDWVDDHPLAPPRTHQSAPPPRRRRAAGPSAAADALPRLTTSAAAAAAAALSRFGFFLAVVMMTSSSLSLSSSWWSLRRFPPATCPRVRGRVWRASSPAFGHRHRLRPGHSPPPPPHPPRPTPPPLPPSPPRTPPPLISTPRSSTARRRYRIRAEPLHRCRPHLPRPRPSRRAGGRSWRVTPGAGCPSVPAPSRKTPGPATNGATGLVHRSAPATWRLNAAAAPPVEETPLPGGAADDVAATAAVVAAAAAAPPPLASTVSSCTPGQGRPNYIRSFIC